ncbi:hypothetical protein ESP62_011150 [Aeromicrobium fastidiosum]|uniref:Uncharacterized protein n=1 Tax=Aeromicrobium fastidiosum TaxID=52699 RepID=A0A641AL82_9ACTN|nr:hypothetical protein ESP62_011150 [Aeromicrobium fastidiosum]
MIVALPGVASADVGYATVGSSTSVSASASYQELSGAKTVLRTVAEFSNHKSSSVKLTRFRLCFSNTAVSGAWVLPRIEKGGGGAIAWEASQTTYVKSGSCTSWYTVNKTFSASPGKFLFVMNTKLGFINALMTSGFRR